MTATNRMWQTIGSRQAHWTLVVNLLIEVDNARGQVGLWALENDLLAGLPKLLPVQREVAQAWLEALRLYHDTYYPEKRLSRLFGRLAEQRKAKEELGW